MEHIYSQPQFGEDWFTYPSLYTQMVNQFPSGSKFVEVGSWKGKSASYMCVEIANSEKNIEFFCVDHFLGSIEHHNGMGDLSDLYNKFISNMTPVEDYYTLLKMPSLDAAATFADASLDFVFIDGSHEYEDVKNDIAAWLPKVKSGGILAGHDYHHPPIQQALAESSLEGFTGDLGIDCWIYQVP